jgi:hypothetical protein
VPESSCRALREAKGTDPRILRIRRKMAVPSSSSSTAQRKHLQEHSHLDKLVIPDLIGRHRNYDTHSAKVARSREQRIQKQRKDGISPTTREGRTTRMKRWKWAKKINRIHTIFEMALMFSTFYALIVLSITVTCISDYRRVLDWMTALFDHSKYDHS